MWDRLVIVNVPWKRTTSGMAQPQAMPKSDPDHPPIGSRPDIGRRAIEGVANLRSLVRGPQADGDRLVEGTSLRVHAGLAEATPVHTKLDEVELL